MAIPGLGIYPLRGFPYSPVVTERANCGPTVLASLLGVDTEMAITLMDNLYKKGWNGFTNIGHIKVVLQHAGIPMTKEKGLTGATSLKWGFPNHHKLIFIQIEGPWEESRYWRDLYTHTHWVLMYEFKTLDVNNPYDGDGKRPIWISTAWWQEEIMPKVVASYQPEGTGWHVRSGYHIGTR